MDWQLAIVILSVTAAGVYLCRQSWRTWAGRKSGGCGGGCDCPSSASAAKKPANTLIGEEELTARLRKRS